MNRIGLISTGITLFFLGAVAPAYARQDQHDQNSQAPKQEQAKPEAQQQRQEQAKPTEPEQAKANSKPPQGRTQAPTQAHQQPVSQTEQTNADEHQQRQAKNQQAILSRQPSTSSRVPQRTADAQTRQHAEPALHLSATTRNRIPDERFHSNFGRTHEFRIGSPRMIDGYSRFQYGGYWFGFVQPWPGDWYYTDDVYVDFIGGQYYLCNPYYPGVHIAISVVM